LDINKHATQGTHSKRSIVLPACSANAKKKPSKKMARETAIINTAFLSLFSRNIARENPAFQQAAVNITVQLRFLQIAAR
jgi:hypothetical protein